MHIFTSESVSQGHPDKVCDRISDAILDYFLGIDPQARVACETLVTDNYVLVAGEVTTTVTYSPEMIQSIVRSTIKEIGYEQEGFHHAAVQIDVRLNRQSPDIARGVNRDGAGDQGLMFGYAKTETENFMPLAIYLANKITQKYETVVGNPRDKFFGPDMKTQVSVEYEGSVPIKVTDVLVSAQHLNERASPDEVRERFIPTIKTALGKWWNDDIHILTNPTGKFHIGGPVGDCGLTGRKIIVDTYGGAAPHGGGAFSGKDPTKVDRSAAYMARYIAKNVVHQGYAEECLIQLSYAIGQRQPVSFMVTCDGVPNNDIAQIISDRIDLQPAAIIELLDLRRPIYGVTASGGHFGRPAIMGLFPWEAVNLDLGL